MLRDLDSNSSTERDVRRSPCTGTDCDCPTPLRNDVPDIYCQPDFYYEPRFWVFCDGSPHDNPQVRERDNEQRQLLIARGDEVWSWHYSEDLGRQDCPAARYLQEGSMSTSLQPGKLVSLRGREWVVLPSDSPDLLVVKPLGGSDEETTGIYPPTRDPVRRHPARRPIRSLPPSEDLGDISTARFPLRRCHGWPSATGPGPSAPWPSSRSALALTRSCRW